MSLHHTNNFILRAVNNNEDSCIIWNFEMLLYRIQIIILSCSQIIIEDEVVIHVQMEKGNR